MKKTYLNENKTSTMPARERHRRRGSVLILVIAVLVLLALMGTAFIATSRSDRVVAGTGTTAASVDQLAQGVIEGLKAKLARDMVATPGGSSGLSARTNLYTGFSLNTPNLIASRVPTAPGTAVPDSIPRWYTLTAPLDADSATPGQFVNPAPGADVRIGPNVFHQGAGTTTGKLSQDYATWGRSELARKNVWIGAVTLTESGQTVPAFAIPNQTQIARGLDTTDGTQNGFVDVYPFNTNVNAQGSISTTAIESIVIAGDADGDGIPDSGLIPLGTVASPEYADVTFYYGLRVIDNNSALNVNTAWTSEGDWTVTGGTKTNVRNNRLFTSAIGLRETLAAGSLASGSYNEFDGSSRYGSNINANFIGFRSGTLGLTADGGEFTDHYIPVRDFDLSTGRPTTSGNIHTRDDFYWTSQHELHNTQLASRLDNPGSHGPASLNALYQMRSFSIADQAELGYGFILAPRPDITSDYTTILAARSSLERLLPVSLYRFVPGNTDPSYPTITAYGTLFANMRSSPYPPTLVGRQEANRSNAASATWFNQNFQYFVNPTSPATFDVLNLRPLVVSRNPVSQVSPFKPLPQSAVFGVTDAESMTPYVQNWDATLRYAPGEVVYRATSATNGAFYVNVARVRTSVNIDPSNANYRVLPSRLAEANAAKPWMVYNGSVVPGKVNVNTARFGDLWRAFYLVMAGDAINVADASGPSGTPLTYGGATGSNATISPFGVPKLRDTTTRDDNAVTDVVTDPDPLEELYRGMHFTGTTANPTQLRPATAGSATAAQGTYHPQRMFRSNIKDYNTTNTQASILYLPPDQMIRLRSAQAAVNAEYLRAINNSATSVVDNLVRRDIYLNSNRVTGGTADMVATVYSHGRFPYITEIYYSNDGYTTPLTNPALPFDATTNPALAANPSGYIAVELYNPYPFAISLANWKLQIIPRQAGTVNASGTGRTPVDVFTFNATAPSIPANGFLILENISTGGAAPGTPGAVAGTPANYRPASTNLPRTGSIARAASVTPPLEAVEQAYVPNLAAVITSGTPGELVLLRPMNAIETGGTLVASATTLEKDFAPVDSFDFTGFAVPVATPNTPVTLYHYARQSTNWRFVYPGRYDGRQTGLRHQGTVTQTYNTSGTALVDADTVERFTTPSVTLSRDAGGTAQTAANVTASYSPTFPVQIANIGFGGINGAITDNNTGANSFPFGGFARELDLLQIPYISPVRLTPVGVATIGIYDLISLTQDASFAEDTDTTNDAEENIGRFTPIIVPEVTIGTNPPVDSIFTEIDEFGANKGKLRYGWANDLLDYVTVRSTRDMTLPNVGTEAAATSTPPYSSSSYVDSTTNATLPQPVSVARSASGSSVANKIEAYSAGVEGLVNINTAPLPVLAAVPWVRTSVPGNDRQDNLRIAAAIIEYRERNGPFRSIFELNKVRGFRTLNATDNTLLTGINVAPARGTEPLATAAGTNSAFSTNTFLTNDNGDFSPLGTAGVAPGTTPNPAFPGTLSALAPQTDPRNVVADYESQFLNVIAVSNLITTRSDTFTAYIVIEGWRNAGTPKATRVMQKRYAYILDRTGVAAGLPTPLINPTTPANSAVVSPSGKTRSLDTTVRVYPIPVVGEK